MKMGPATSVYSLGLLLSILVRAAYARRPNGRLSRRPESWLVPVCMALWGLSQLAAVVYISSSWLDFANYSLPRWLSVIGGLIFAAAVVLLWRSHVDLGRNFSPLLEIQPTHQLVTGGVYRQVRHPMYAAHWLWCIGQPLLLPNWLAGPTALLSFAPLYFLRVPQEERIMLDTFGEAYRDYMQRTGRIWPRLSRPSKKDFRSEGGN